MLSTARFAISSGVSACYVSIVESSPLLNSLLSIQLVVVSAVRHMLRIGEPLLPSVLIHTSGRKLCKSPLAVYAILFANYTEYLPLTDIPLTLLINPVSV